MEHRNLHEKINRILHFILVAMLLILVRIWHLSVIQYDQKVEESIKPQRKSIVEPAVRATIRDRFNLPLAINKISYQATILYSQLRDIPSFTWQKNSTGNRIKIFKRKIYIHQLSEMLARELKLDEDRIEDLIHAKASYYFQVPFIIKDDLTEQEYYRLKMLERDWPGLHVRIMPKRYYPKGRVAADVIGYMGAINRPEYEKIFHEIKALDQFLHEQENEISPGESSEILEIQHVRERLKNLQAKAYTLQDYVGKTGIEAVYEEQLRGFYGKKNFYTDSKGKFLGELPGSCPPLAGHRILLTLSSELQEYAEQLLAENEVIRVTRMSNTGGAKKTVLAQKQPWIKGGAIVVMDPKEGDVLALATYPRFDPNDFILCGNKETQKIKKNRIHRWFENETYLAGIWDQQQTLERERYNNKNQAFNDEELFLSWKKYLHFILPSEGKLMQAMSQILNIGQAIEIQRHIKILQSHLPTYDLYTIFNYLYASDPHKLYRPITKENEKQKFLDEIYTHKESLLQVKKKLDPYLNDLPHNYDKVLLVDLCRLAVAEDRFSEELFEKKRKESLSDHHDQTGSLVTLLSFVKETSRSLFHKITFKQWRENKEKIFLKTKREEEKQSKTHPKPYLDYLDQEENRVFNQFWETHCWDLLLAFLTGEVREMKENPHPENLTLYLTHFRQEYDELHKEELPAPHWKQHHDRLKEAIKNLPFHLKLDYLKSMRSYKQLNKKLLGSYRFQGRAHVALEKHLAAAFYPIYGFGYGRSHAYRQASIQGSLFKLVVAYEVLRQRFEKMGKKTISPKELNPLIIIDQVYTIGNTRYVGYREDGTPIPQLYKGGRLPRSLAHQNNGRVDLLKALEVSSNPYFSLLVGECLDNPEDLAKAARLFSFGSRTGIDLPSEISGKVPEDLATNRTGLYAMGIGQHSLVVTPLQTAVMLATIANGGRVLKPKLVKLTVGGKHPIGKEQIPLAAMDNKNWIKPVPTVIMRELFMPEVIRHMLLDGLRACSLRTHQENLTNLTHLYRQYPEAIRQFTEFKDQLIGKTSTSESVENIDLDLLEGTNIYTHVWFGSIAFNDKKSSAFLLKDEFGQPELIIVVYLRYGGYGKEAAPLAAQIVKKWRELNREYAK